MKIRTLVATTLAGAFSLALATAAPAATCNVTDADGHPVSNYTVETNVSSACYAWGNGNINGTDAHDPILAGAATDISTFTPVSPLIAGLEYLGEVAFTQYTEDGKVKGTITIGSLADGFANLVLALKFGDNWASFLIAGADDPFSFEIDPKKGAGISHVNLYGTPAVVPVPAAGVLLLGALGGLSLLRRRNKA